VVTEGTSPVSVNEAPTELSGEIPLSEPMPTAAKRQPSLIEAPARPVVTAPPTPRAAAATKPTEIVRAQRPAPPQSKVEVPLPAPDPIVAHSAPQIPEAPAPSVPAAQPPVAEKAPAKAPVEQLTSLVSRQPQSAPAKPMVARPAAPKPLEGFIIQLAFSDKGRALRWAEGMEKKGFAISITEAGTEGALRVRLGNFVLRDDAERQLKAIKQEGLNGIILNLPQAFVPAARSSIP